jgi:hypothetical protein
MMERAFFLVATTPTSVQLPFQVTPVTQLTNVYLLDPATADQSSAQIPPVSQVNPYNVSGNEDAWIGTIRTTFNF